MVKQNYEVIWDDEAKASLRKIYKYIVYETTKEYVIILDVFHTCRDPQNLNKLKRK